VLYYTGRKVLQGDKQSSLSRTFLSYKENEVLLVRPLVIIVVSSLSVQKVLMGVKKEEKKTHYDKREIQTVKLQR
jgi:hypothetical protein